MGKPEGRRSFGRPENRQNIKLDVKEIRRKGVDWVYLAEDRDMWWAVLDAVMNVIYFVFNRVSR
jgi:hypothetical protein